MTGRYEHVLAFVYSHPWALDISMRAELARILARRIVGQDATPDEIAAALVQRKNLPQPKRGGVAVIPIYGVVAPRMNLLSDVSGGTTFEQLTAQLRAAVADPQVATIVFDVSSPGGNVAGATEFAHEVMKARTVKPVIAQAEHLMASAAFWPMACATEIVASPSAHVGSVGVYTIHEDVTDAMAKLGVKQDVIGAGKFKTEGVGGGPLSDEARAHMQGLVDAHYTRMVGDIAKGRGVSADAVRAGFGEGRVVDAATAVSLGMIDRVATLDDTLARVLAKPHALTSTATAVTDQEPVTATSKELTDALWQNETFGALVALDL